MAYLVDKRLGSLLATIYPQDKIKNANQHRRTLQSVSEHKMAGSQADSDPIPPLLQKLLSDYAATGLPPAYLPKEQIANDQKGQ